MTLLIVLLCFLLISYLTTSFAINAATLEDSLEDSSKTLPVICIILNVIILIMFGLSLKYRMSRILKYAIYLSSIVSLVLTSVTEFTNTDNVINDKLFGLTIFYIVLAIVLTIFSKAKNNKPRLRDGPNIPSSGLLSSGWSNIGI